MIMRKTYLIVLLCTMVFGQGMAQNEWKEVNKVVHDYLDPGDYFGNVDIEGEWGVIGSHRDDEDTAQNYIEPFLGSAFVIKKECGGWVKKQQLIASDFLTEYLAMQALRFGIHVKIEGDYIFVGALAQYDDLQANYVLAAGGIYVFKHNSSTDEWDFDQKIVAPVRNAWDMFGGGWGAGGFDVDGNTLIVGASSHDFDGGGNPIAGDAGAVFVFENMSGTWTHQQTLTAIVPEVGDKFGGSVAISGDYCVIGSRNHDLDVNDNPTGFNQSGAAFVFKRTAGLWGFEQKIVDEADRATWDHFASSVQIDGNVMAINHTQNSAGYKYYVNLYEHNGTDWIFKQKFSSIENTPNSDFGGGFHISGDLLVIGEKDNRTDENVQNESISMWGTGAVYVYQRDGVGSWNMIQKIAKPDREIDPARQGRFGFHSGLIALDGNNLAIGDENEYMDEFGLNPLTGGGAVYFFEIPEPTTDSVVNINICYGDSTLISTSFKDSTGIYLDTLFNQIGCDSVYIEFNLNIADTAILEYDTVVLANGENIEINGVTYATGGDVLNAYPFPSNALCDSLIQFTHIVGPTTIEYPEINIPNIFTPNGDEFNDVLVIDLLTYNTLDVVVYNRWGNEVFTGSENEHWDGTIGDKEAQEGTYFCVVKASSTENEIFEYSGAVLLKRK